MNNTATNTGTCPTVRKQIGKTTYIVRVHFSQTAKETMEDKIKRLLREDCLLYTSSELLEAESQRSAEAIRGQNQEAEKGRN